VDDALRAPASLPWTTLVRCPPRRPSPTSSTATYHQGKSLEVRDSRIYRGDNYSDAGGLTGVSPEQMAKMEQEMSNLQGQYKLVEQTYGQDVLNLVLAKGYLAKLLENESARLYVAQRHPDLMVEFESIIATISLDQQQSSVVL
jgi:hypothetical protein